MTDVNECGEMMLQRGLQPAETPMKNTPETAARADEETRICSHSEGMRLPKLNPTKSVADWEAWHNPDNTAAKIYGRRLKRKSKRSVQDLFDASEALS